MKPSAVIVLQRNLLIIIALGISAIQAFAVDSFIVENGKTNAEIVIAEKPQRTSRLAAAKLPDLTPDYLFLTPFLYSLLIPISDTFSLSLGLRDVQIIAE